uniref:EGF-like domain-containing protein n=1 Tax=Steinernema glaseri TaxID=37863 RepID=A0A1I7YDN2_9BILA
MCMMDGSVGCGDGSDCEDGVHYSKNAMFNCEKFGKCSQRCSIHVPVRGVFTHKCYCDHGYTRNGTSCKSVDHRKAEAIMIDGRLVRKFKSKASGRGLDITTKILSRVIVDFDYFSENGENVTYVWLDNNIGTLKKGSLDDMLDTEKRQKRYKREMSNPPMETLFPHYRSVVAVDHINKNVYTTADIVDGEAL